MTSMLRLMAAKAFPNDPAFRARFEDQMSQIYKTADAVSQGVAATESLQDATVIVLSANGAFTNERVLELGSGLKWTVTAGSVKIEVDKVPAIGNGFKINFLPLGDCNIVLPIAGQLATREGVETFKGKTLDKPSLSGLGDYANDATAATGGVPVGGMYRTGSALMVRVT